MTTTQTILENKGRSSLITKDNSDKFGQFQQENIIMAFVNELIPEAEKEKFTFPVKTRPDGSKPTLWKWTIDRERDVFLVLTNIWGGGYEGTPEEHHYVLCWKSELIPFKAGHQLSGSKADGYILSWQVHHLDIPSTLQDREKEVLQLIQEALDTQALLYDRQRYVAVDVKFDHPISR